MIASYTSRINRRSVFRKVNRVAGWHEAEAPADTPIVALAVAAEERMAGIVRRWFDVVADSLPLKELETALMTKNPLTVLEVVNIEHRLGEVYHGTGLNTKETSLQEIITNLYREGAYAELRELDRIVAEVQKADNSYGAAFRFDVLNPYSVEWLRARGGELIREISEDTRRSIMDVVVEGFEQGRHPYEQAVAIRNVVGLTQRQSRAVGNFQRLLAGEGADLQEAMRRALRDKRFDRTLQRQIDEDGLLSQDQIQKMTQRYYERYKQYRAQMIARTETIRAANAGQQGLWEQNAELGLLPEERTRKIWITGPGACPLCLAIEKLNADGVRLKEPFKAEGGSIEFPPLHPHCRCGMGLKFLRHKISRDEIRRLLGLTVGGETLLQEAKTLEQRMAAYRASGAKLRKDLQKQAKTLTRKDLLAAERMNKLAEQASEAVATGLTGPPHQALLNRLAKAEDTFWEIRRKKQDLVYGSLKQMAGEGERVSILFSGIAGDVGVFSADEAAVAIRFNAGKARRFVEGVVSLPENDGKKVAIEILDFDKIAAKMSRGYAEPEKGLIVLSSKHNAAVHVHEIGHILEQESPEIRAVALKFLEERNK